jgi:circadian clock protein KaiA
LSAPLTIAIFTDSQPQADVLARYLDGERYVCWYFTDRDEFIDRVDRQQNGLDCLLLHAPESTSTTVDRLSEKRILLPAVAIDPTMPEDRPYLYQPGEVVLAANGVAEVTIAIDTAIANFLNLTPAERTEATSPVPDIDIDLSKSTFLLQQQSRLADKLRERLGYLAVYYKRNSNHFYRHFDRQQKQEFLHKLKTIYRHIVLNYFQEDADVNDEIDEFVSAAFFADLSVSEIVKLHMDLMEEFSTQLKLEGRSEEILLDYRLTLIDTIAHLCEMYRRSIPREL